MGKGNFFVYTTLPDHGVQPKLYVFFGSENSENSCFFAIGPQILAGPFGALGEMVHFAPWDLSFDFLFPSYGRFRKKKTQTHQKVLPQPTDGVPSTSNSPSTWVLKTRLFEKNAQHFFCIQIVGNCKAIPKL